MRRRASRKATGSTPDSPRTNDTLRRRGSRAEGRQPHAETEGQPDAIVKVAKQITRLEHDELKLLGGVWHGLGSSTRTPGRGHPHGDAAVRRSACGGRPRDRLATLPTRHESPRRGMARHPRVLGLGDRGCRGVAGPARPRASLTCRDLTLDADARKRLPRKGLGLARVEGPNKRGPLGINVVDLCERVQAPQRWDWSRRDQRRVRREGPLP